MAFNRVLWSATALDPLMDEMVLVDFTDRQYEKDVDANEAIEVPLLGSITAQDGQATDTTIDTVSGESTTKILIDQESFSGIRIKKVDELQSNINKVASYSAQMTKVIKQKAMTLNLAIYMATNCAAANKMQFTGLVSGNTTLTYDGLVALAEKMNVAMMPFEDRYLVVTPAYYSALMKIVDGDGAYVFFSKDYSASGVNDFEKGTVAKGMGFNVIMTNNLPKLTTTGTYDTTTPANNTQDMVLAFQRSAVAAVIQQEVSFNEVYNATKRASDIVGSCIWGRKVIRDTGIFAIRKNT